MTSPSQGSPDPAETADSVAAATLSVPGVIRMHTGAFGEVSTYLPGRRVDGVRLREGATEVHVVLSSTVSLMETAQSVRQIVAAITLGEVDVYVEDLSDERRAGDDEVVARGAGDARDEVVVVAVLDVEEADTDTDTDTIVVPATEIDPRI